MRAAILGFMLLLLVMLSIDPVGADEGISVKDLNITTYEVQDCSTGCYRMTGAWIVRSGSGVYVSVKSNFSSLSKWTLVSNKGAVVSSGTPAFAYPANMITCYTPFKETGPYMVYAGTDPAKSDKMVGLGLPNYAGTACHPLSIYVEFVREESKFSLLIPVVK
jgi:hypothetical protein